MGIQRGGNRNVGLTRTQVAGWFVYLFIWSVRPVGRPLVTDLIYKHLHITGVFYFYRPLGLQYPFAHFIVAQLGGAINSRLDSGRGGQGKQTSAVPLIKKFFNKLIEIDLDWSFYWYLADVWHLPLAKRNEAKLNN